VCFQVYPTTVRALGLGTANAMSRFGAIITPFVSEVNHVNDIARTMPLYTLYDVCCLPLSVVVVFTARRCAFCSVCYNLCLSVCLCLSVRPSQVAVLPNWLTISTLNDTVR